MDIREQWQQTPFWQRLFLVFVLSGAIVYLIYTISIEPQKQQYESLQSEVESLESQLETLKVSADERMLDKLNQKIKQIKAQNEEKLAKIEQYKTLIPSKPEVENVLYFISESAKLSGAKLNSFKIEKEEDIKLYYDQNDNTLKTFQQDDKNKDQKPPENIIHLKRVYIQTNLTGDIKSVFKFIDTFSNSKRVMNIDRLEIKKEATKLNYVVSVSVYYSLEE